MSDDLPTSSPHGSPARYGLGCRCAECTEAKRVLSLVYSRAKTRAAQQFRRRNPGEWDRFLDEEYDRLGLVRNPAGRPPSTDSKWGMA